MGSWRLSCQNQNQRQSQLDPVLPQTRRDPLRRLVADLSRGPESVRAERGRPRIRPEGVCVCVCVSGLRASAAGSMARVPQAVSGVSPDTPAGPLAPNHRPIMWRLGGGGVTDTDEMLLIISRTWWRSPVLSPPLSCPGLFNKQTIFVCKRGGGGRG